MSDADDPQPDIELRLDAPVVPLGKLAASAGAFAGIANEVAREYAGTRESPVEWLADVRRGSIRLPVTGRPRSRDFHAGAMHQIAETIVAGLAVLEAGHGRPAYFSDKALASAKQLANLASDDLPIYVRDGGEPVRITRRTGERVDALLGPHQRSFGTVEGKLEALDIHGQRDAFAVWETLSGRRVDCYFDGENVGLEDVMAAVGRRVGVRGTITSKPTGERVSVEACQIDVMPAEGELPPVETAYGILAG